MRTSHVSALAFIAATLVVAAPALAGTYGFGSVVGGKDADTMPSAKAQAVSLCSMDDDGNMMYNAGEPLYLLLRAACDEVKSKDLRLLSMDPKFGPGSEVKATDSDHGTPVWGPVPHAIRWLDYDGTSKWSSKDTMVLDLLAIGAPKLGAGDFRLTKQGDIAGATTVKGTDPLVGSGLSELGGAVTMISDPNVFYKAGSAFYINSAKTAFPGKTLVASNDVRMNAEALDHAGSGSAKVEVTSLKAEPASPEAGAVFCITVGAKNSGTAGGTRLVTTTLGDTVLDARSTPWLWPGENATITAQLIAPAEPGEYLLKVDGKNITLTVKAATASPATEAAVTEAVTKATMSLQQRVDELTTQVQKQDAEMAAMRAMFGALSAPDTQAASTVQVASQEAKPLARATPGPDPLTLLAVLGCAALLVLTRRK